MKKPIKLPPEVARSFVDAMNDYFAEDNPTKRDAIAAHQLSVLGQYQNPRDGKLRLSDIKECFASFATPKSIHDLFQRRALRFKLRVTATAYSSFLV